MKNVLLVRFGGLGDLIVTLPSIRFLRAKFPDARLTLVSRKQYGELFLEAGIVDELMPEDSRRLLPIFKTDASSDSDFAGWFAAFDCVMVWTQGSPEDFLLKAPGIQAGRTQPCIIQANPGEKEPLNRAFFRKTAESVGETSILAAEDWSRLPLAGISKNAGPKIVIHPGSGSEAKRWPLRNFLQIIAELGKKEIAGTLVTGEAEENIAPLIQRTALPLNWNWARCPSLLALTKLLSASEYYLGNDSGVTHLAAACGAAVVALFRSEFAFAWRPLGRVRVLSAASLTEISLEFVRKNFFLK